MTNAMGLDSGPRCGDLGWGACPGLELGPDGGKSESTGCGSQPPMQRSGSLPALLWVPVNLLRLGFLIWKMGRMAPAAFPSQT